MCLLRLLLLACLGCARPGADARPPEHARVAHERGWIGIDAFPEVREASDQASGAAALSAVLAYWGRPIPPGAIESTLGPGERSDWRAGALRDFAEERGFAAFVFPGSFSDIERELGLSRPVIVGAARRRDGALQPH